MTKTLDNITVTLNENVPDKEIQAYINRGREKQKHMKLIGIDIDVDGEEADIAYQYDKTPFTRIRRITGYLVGGLDRFNNAKRIEVADRVTHSISDDCEDVYVS